MTLEAVPWLPPAAAGEVETALSELARQWLSDWLVEAWVCQANPSGPLETASLRWFGCPIAAIGIGQDQLVRLGDGILAGRADLQNPRDAELLSAIGTAAIEDFGRRLCQLAEAEVHPDSFSPEICTSGPLRYCLSEPRTAWRAEFRFDPVALTRLRKRWAGTRREPELTAVSSAVACEEVELGCRLGGASLLAADLQELAPGDLLVLDRCVDEDLPLTVEGRALATGTARIVAGGEAFSVEITQVGDRLLFEAGA